MKTRGRKVGWLLLRVTGALAVVILLLIFTLPLWFGAALGAIGSRSGLTFADYSRDGYGRFILDDVAYARPGMRASAKRIEADSPLAWVWHRLTGKGGEFRFGEWTVTIEAGSKPPPVPPDKSAPSGWMPVRTQVREIVSRLEPWLSRATLGAGTVRLSNKTLTVAGATWHKRTLTLDRLSFQERTIDVQISLPALEDEINVQADTETDEARIHLRSRGAAVSGRVAWWGQPAVLKAEFGTSGFIPTLAEVAATDWNLPAERLKMGKIFKAIAANARIEWRDNAYTVDLSAQSTSLGEKAVPPLDIVLKGQGDLEAITLERFRLQMPGAQAQLSAPVTIARSGEIRNAPARLTADLDLAQLPWIKASGTLTAEADVARPDGPAAPPIDFRVEARDVAAEGVSLASAALRGRLEWLRVRLAEATVVGVNKEQIRVSGGWDIKAREANDITVAGQLNRETFARWLPKNVTFTSVVIDASARGPMAEIEHRGTLKVQHAVAGPSKPLELALQWNGIGQRAEQMVAEISAGASRVSFAAAVDKEHARLTAMEFSPAGEEPLRLAQPATLRWLPTLRIEAFELRSAQGGISANAAYGNAGHIALALRGIRSSWFNDFITMPEPAWTLSSVALNGSWDNGPMRFEAVADLTAVLRDKREVAANVHLNADGNGARILAFRAMEGGTPVLSATGTIPAVITPSGKPILQLNADGALALNATTVENAAFWEQLGKLAGVTLTAPRLTVNMTGTWRAPKGDIRGQIERVEFAKKSEKSPPAIERVELALAGTRSGIALERLAFQVEGQPVQVSGNLPLPEKDWDALRQAPLAYLRRGADLRINVPKAEIAAFAGLLPKTVAPQGSIAADITLQHGALAGSLQLHNAGTHSLGALGALHEVAADVKLDGEIIQVRNISALLGGEPIRISGTVTLPPLDSFQGKGSLPLPAFDVKAQATNIPLVRSAGTLVRTDLHIALVSPANGSPLVSGKVRLRESLFFQDVRGLLPKGTKSKSTRPPYFAVEAEPFSQWRLDIAVVGDEFMRLRTTVFNGTASADFRLGGTLGEPTLIGDATIDRGRVQLPFATFEVEEGRISLTPAQPHEPEIWVTAKTRRYEYDLRMEISGNASSPTLKFESTPSLEHGQVLLMVMAGVVPNDEVAFTQQQRATRLGTYLGRSLLSSFGDSDDTNRLTIEGGKDISEQGRETYEIEYAFNKRWSLTAEYDEYDTESLGVKWLALSRGGTKLASSGTESLASNDAARAPGELRESGESRPRETDNGSKPAKIDVSGLGMIADFEMESALKRLLGEERGATLDPYAVEDALFLLLSGVREGGYLRPSVRIHILNADGTEREFTAEGDLTKPVPRDIAARAVRFQVTRGIHYVLQELDMSGLQALEHEVARAYFVADPGLLKRQAALTFTPDRLKRGVAGLESALRERGYADATVTAAEPRIDHDTGRVAVAIEVHEGPRWQISTVSVEGEVSGIESLGSPARYPGKPWSEAVEQDIAAEVRKSYLVKGYPDARVRVSHQAQPAANGARLVDVIARVEPGPPVKVGEIRFEGNVTTNEAVLRRRVRLAPGDPLNPLAAQQARHRIARLGVFQDVAVRFEPPEGDRRDVVYFVEPGKKLQLNLLAGYNSYEQLRAGVELRQYNVWSRAHQTRALFVQSMKSTRAEYSYTVPELFGEQMTGTARLTGLRREEIAFLREEYGLRLTVDTPLRFLGANATIGYSFELLNNSESELETSPTDAEHDEVASIEAGLTRDRRDNPLLPRDGYRWYGRTELASQLLGGSAEYQRTEFGGAYHRAWRKGRWLHFGAGHGVITTYGTTDENLPVNKLFFPGGDGSNRGYQTGEAAPRGADGQFVGAKTYLSATAEIEQALTSQWSAVAFVDALGSAATLSEYPFDEVLVAVGLGVRYQTLIGPVRAEYGYNLNPRPGDPQGTFLVSIGFSF